MNLSLLPSLALNKFCIRLLVLDNVAVKNTMFVSPILWLRENKDILGVAGYRGLAGSDIRRYLQRRVTSNEGKLNIHGYQSRGSRDIR